MKNKVSMAFQERHTDYILRWNAWVVTPVGRWPVFQRFAWWFLNKRKAVKPYHEMVISYTKVDLDGDKILHVIMQAKEHLFEIGKRPEKVLIGSEDLDELMHDTQFRKIPDITGINGRMGYGREIFDLPVIIVPHMKGCLVL